MNALAAGVVYRFFYVDRGPWAIHILDVDRAACWTPVAVKAGAAALGRAKTSTLISELARALPSGGLTPPIVAGGVNGDFFSYEPSGVPRGAHVAGGRVITGPSSWPVFAVDSGGRPRIGTLEVNGVVILGLDTFRVDAWNRTDPDGLAFFDSGWGTQTDTTTGVLEVALAGRGMARVIRIDTTALSVTIPRDGGVLLLGPQAPAGMRERLLQLQAAEPVRLQVSLHPFHPLEAIGGFPVLLRDSVPAADLDSAGGVRFAPVRHPRTAVGIAHEGRRLLLVAVDGRQPPYSDGMTLGELAGLMRELGARDALNLDGGGSTTMVVVDPDAPGGFRVANRPSDREGERPVANALALLRLCAEA